MPPSKPDKDGYYVPPEAFHGWGYNPVTTRLVKEGTVFGFRSNPHARAEALVKHAHSVWDKADVELRTLLLRNVKDFEDDRLFLAYVNAPWAQLPDNFRLNLTRVIIVYEDTPGVLKGR